MAQVLIRDVNPATIEKLKKRARENGRSLQSELKQILENAAPYSFAEARAAAERVRKRLGGRRFSDSTALVREDRDR